MNQLFERPVRMLAQRVRVKGGVVDVYAIAWAGGYDRQVVAMMFGGRKTHVQVAWANIMGGKVDVTFSLPGHGWMAVKKLAGKGLYKSSDLLLPCGATVKFLYLRQMTIEGARMLGGDEPNFYYLVSQGDENREALRFARYLQATTLLALRPDSSGVSVNLRWAHDLLDVGRRRRLVSQLQSEGLKVFSVSRDGESWRDAIGWGMSRGMFPMDGGF